MLNRVFCWPWSNSFAHRGVQVGFPAHGMAPRAGFSCCLSAALSVFGFSGEQEPGLPGRGARQERIHRVQQDRCAATGRPHARAQVPTANGRRTRCPKKKSGHPLHPAKSRRDSRRGPPEDHVWQGGCLRVFRRFPAVAASPI